MPLEPGISTVLFLMTSPFIRSQTLERLVRRA
jgi:hypothetical protein